MEKDVDAHIAAEGRSLHRCAALNHERCANSVMINLIVRLPFHRVYCIEKLIQFSR